MSRSLKERGAKILFEWSDGKVVISDESVEFYGDGAESSLAPSYLFGMSADNFYDVIAAFEEYHSSGD
jgi:hypothetical protein